MSLAAQGNDAAALHTVRPQLLMSVPLHGCPTRRWPAHPDGRLCDKRRHGDW